MEEYPDKITLHFHSTRENIPGILEDCLRHIRLQTANAPLDAQMLAKIKWVLIEMLTNAVKHSGVKVCTISIGINDGMLILEKEDHGKPLVLNENESGRLITWPLDDFSDILDFQIYHNGLDSLRVRAEKPGKAIFFVEQLTDTDTPDLLLETSEHFGLMIMVKASEEFTYEYDPAAGINRFRTIFNLNTTDYEAQV